jgi:Fe-S oxidoreductase
MSCLMHISGGLEKQNAGIRYMHIAQLLDERI